MIEAKREDIERVAEAISIEYGQHLADRPIKDQSYFRRDARIAITTILNPPDLERDELMEQGRVLASEREDLIIAGADPNELEIPLAPIDLKGPPLPPME